MGTGEESRKVWDGKGVPGIRDPSQVPGVGATYHLPTNVLPAGSHRLPEGLPVGPI